jgi:hypothetical protein
MIDENDGDPIIILQSPIIIEIMETPMGSFIKVNPWMKIPNDDFFMIKLDKVITMTEITDQSTIEIYNRYLNDDSDNMVDKDGKVKLSNQMGYISSVQEARERLEKLLKDT